MFGSGIRILLLLGRPWLYSFAWRFGRAFALLAIGKARRQRLANQLAAADPAKLEATVNDFLARHGFTARKSEADADGVSIAGLAGNEALLVRVQTAQAGCSEQVLDNLRAAAGSDASALLICTGAVAHEIRTAAGTNSPPIGVLDNVELADELLAIR